MTWCLMCMQRLDGRADRYHDACLRSLFGRARAPRIEATREALSRIAQEMVGRVSMSGVQKKLAMALDPGADVLTVARSGTTHILKPQIETLPNVPENEALTMVLAGQAGIAVPPCGLFALPDGSWAYLIRRFDRTRDGRKLRLEDFCQLAEKPAKEKYEGSLELCARLILRHATAPIVEAARFFRLAAFSWWVGNEDLHLKNLAVLGEATGNIVLAPAYDLVSSGLYFKDQELALTLGGKRSKIRLREWQDLGERCKLPSRAVNRVLADLASRADRAEEFVRRSQLPERLQADYIELLGSRSAILAAA